MKQEGSSTDSLFVAYIVTYCLFGVWSVVTFYVPSVRQTAAISEVGYSILGFVAKVGDECWSNPCA